MMFEVNKHYGGKFPSFGRPKAVGYFSIDGQRCVSFDSTQMGYYAPVEPDEKFHIDLNHGLEKMRHKPADLEEKIDHLLRWIERNLPKVVLNSPDEGQWIKPKFVCWRGLLTKIMITPYYRDDGWILHAAKFKGTIYLCFLKAEQAKYENNNVTPKQQRFMSWGFKFEQYLLSDSPGGKPDISKPVDQSEEFSVVFQSYLDSYHLLYGAEVDGVISNELLSDPLAIETLKFIEFKTSREAYNHHQMENMKRFKFIKWWCQSFLVAIENIICGFRDDRGIVRELKNYPVSQIEHISKRHWSGSGCMNFCAEFLKFVEKTVVKECHETMYKFERFPQGNIVASEVQPSPEIEILPLWYKQLAK